MAISEGSSDPNVPAISGHNSVSGGGVQGDSASGTGVFGSSITSAGVAAESSRGPAVKAVAHGAQPTVDCVNDNAGDDAGPGLRASSRAAGVIGQSLTWMGVYGVTESNSGGNGVMGQAVGGGAGVAGDSTDEPGVAANSHGAAPGPACGHAARAPA